MLLVVLSVGRSATDIHVQGALFLTLPYRWEDDTLLHVI